MGKNLPELAGGRPLVFFGVFKASRKEHSGLCDWSDKRKAAPLKIRKKASKAGKFFSGNRLRIHNVFVIGYPSKLGQP